MQHTNQTPPSIQPHTISNSTPGPAHSSHCNRLLSRSARKILQNNIVPVIRAHLPANRNWTTAISEKTTTCRLDPRYDLFLHHETRSTHFSERNAQLHLCGICQKTFLTKYYLDRHFDLRHSNETGTGAAADGASICLATEICPAFGELCRDISRKLEPNYGPGSGDKRRTTNKPSPCNEELMERSRQKCYVLFEECFTDPDLLRDLKSHVCDTVTCSYRLHSLAGYVHYHIHHAKEVWDEEHEHAVGILGVFVLVCVCLFYLGLGCWRGCWVGKRTFFEKKRRRDRRKGDGTKLKVS